MVDEINVVIIGAGVIGLAVAAEVASRGHGLYVVEGNKTFGKETSSRGSGVIHAGIYYPGGSLKAKTCVEGSAMVYEPCEKHGIGFKRLGKLVVATTEGEVERLEELLDRGRDNGVRGLRMLPQGEIKGMEPYIQAVAALLSPSTGIVDSYSLMKYFLREAEGKGANIVYKSKVTEIEKVPGGYRLIVQDDSGAFSFKTRIVVNCAGLNSDAVAELAGVNILEAGYKLHYCKGEYFRVANGKNKLIKRLVYPAPHPEDAGLGIHVTLDLEGQMYLGPSAQYIDEINYGVDESGKLAFHNAVKGFLPFVDYEDLEPHMAGIRPKLQGPGEDFKDFVIKHECDRGLPGFINLIGIESPGFTSCPAIARLVGTIVDEILN